MLFCIYIICFIPSITVSNSISCLITRTCINLHCSKFEMTPVIINFAVASIRWKDMYVSGLSLSLSRHVKTLWPGNAYIQRHTE